MLYCQTCSTLTPRYADGRCTPCQAQRAKRARAQHLADPPSEACKDCGARDWYGLVCRPCKNAAKYKGPLEKLHKPCGTTARFSDGKCKHCCSLYSTNRREKKKNSPLRTDACVSCGAVDWFVDGTCRPCKKRYAASVASETSIKLKQRRTRSPEYVLHYSSKSRARIQGLEHTLKKGDIIVPEFCPLLGVRLIPGQDKGSDRSCSPSLDRIDPKKGYVPGNVWVISNRANQIKNDATAEELWKIATKLSQKIASLQGLG